MNKQHKTIVLTRAPNMFLLMLKAAMKRTHKNISANQIPIVDEKMLVLQKRRLSLEKIRLFNQLVAWQGSSEILHPCILHTLFFPLHLSLFLDKSFPFSVVGLVHIYNEINQIRPILASEELDLSCYLTEIESHSKGLMFSVCSQVHVGGKLVWESKSSNLYRLNQAQKISSTVSETHTPPIPEHSQTWQLRGDLGRKYARSSGDYNLIHLSPLLARLFGFKRHIAHGMWTKSRSVSALQHLAPNLFEQQFVVKVKFIKAVFLPTNVEFYSLKKHPSEDVLGFNVDSLNSNSNEKTLHLQGSLN